MTGWLDVHTDNKEMCPLPTQLVAVDVWLFDTNSPNNHYAGTLQGFNKLENWLASVRSQWARMYIVYFDSSRIIKDPGWGNIRDVNETQNFRSV